MNQLNTFSFHRREPPLKDSLSKMREAAADFMAACVPTFLLRRIIGRIGGNITTTIPVSSRFDKLSDYWTIPFQNTYEVHAWVYVCAQIIGRTLVQIPIEPYKTETKDGKQRPTQLHDHPVAQLLRRPNPWLPRYQLRIGTTIFQELTGDAFWYLARYSDGRAGWIIPIRPDRIEPIPDEKEFVKGYEYRVDDKVTRIPAEDILHFKYFSPSSDYRGQGTLEAARKTLIDDVYAEKYNTAFFKNSARPEGAMSFDQVLQKEDFDRIRAELNETFGGVEKAHTIGIFGKGAKWVNIGMSQKDMDFVLLRKMNRLTLASVFGVKPTMVNTYEDVNYNTARQQKKEYWHDTGIPKIIEFVEWLNIYANKFMGKSFGSKEDDFYFGYDLSQVPALIEEERDRMKSETESVKNGIYTINQVLEKRNEDPQPWGDVWWRPMNLAPTTDPESAMVSAPPGGDGGKELILLSDRTREKRLIEWRAFIVHSDYYEGILGNFVANIFRDQEKLVLRNLRKLFQNLAFEGARKKRRPTESELESVLFNLQQAIDTVEKLSTDLYEKIMKAGGNNGYNLVGMSPAFDIDDPLARSMMIAKQQKFAKEVNATTWRRLKRSLVAGAEQGETLSELSDRVGYVMAGRIQSSKLTIARTEVIGVMNGATDAAFKQTGVVEGKEWATAGDGNERADHQGTWPNGPDGQVVDLNGSFQIPNTGELLEYPGDPGGSAAQVINCRCTELPVLKAKQ